MVSMYFDEKGEEKNKQMCVGLVGDRKYFTQKFLNLVRQTSQAKILNSNMGMENREWYCCFVFQYAFRISHFQKNSIHRPRPLPNPNPWETQFRLPFQRPLPPYPQIPTWDIEAIPIIPITNKATKDKKTPIPIRAIFQQRRYPRGGMHMQRTKLQ